jgi:hypothetical protein
MMPMQVAGTTMSVRETRNISHLLIQPIAQLGDAALDLVELAALLLAVALYDVHGYSM